MSKLTKAKDRLWKVERFAGRAPPPIELLSKAFSILASLASVLNLSKMGLKDACFGCPLFIRGDFASTIGETCSEEEPLEVEEA